jgi:hypothetical protein
VQHDAGDDHFTAEVGGSLGVAGGEGAELLQAVDAALDDVALAIDLGIEGRWPSAGGALRLAVADLIKAFRDGRLDASAPQRLTGRAVGVGLMSMQGLVLPGSFGDLG